MWYRHVTVDRYIRSSFLNKVIFFTISSKFYSLSRFDRPDFFCIIVSTSDTTFILYSYLLSGILSTRFIHTPNTFHGSVEINAIISKLSLVSLNFNQRPETHRVKSTQRSWRSSIHEISVTICPSKNRSREIRNLRVVDRGQSSRADRYRPDYANFSKRGLDVGKQKVWISKSRRAYHGSPAREGPLIPVPLSPRESKSGVSHAFPTRSRRSLHAPLPGATRTRLTFTGTGWNFDGAREEPKHEGELAEFPEDSNGFGFPADVSDRHSARSLYGCSRYN